MALLQTFVVVHVGCFKGFKINSAGMGKRSHDSRPGIKAKIFCRKVIVVSAAC
jgi:hypothetical protein